MVFYLADKLYGDDMRKNIEDTEREYRIENEIVVDAYDETERAMGWHCYLDEKLHFPFKAKCIEVRKISPLRKNEEVKVCGMAPQDDCMHEIFVEIKWQDRNLAVPLSQLFPVNADEETTEAVEDWHYWTARGHQF